MKCKWEKMVDYYQHCREEAKPKESIEEGSALGWVLCVMQCSNFSGGMDYDWVKDKCVCRGDYIPPLWRRR